ncbi:unnamed protein product [Clonostachys byssicola]|uniref:Uncharacterized protein n=1 Tax=Clonostachys byssicola TaxID=160290 RepID=A0A9N9UH96_9HYPO|nr:unnamed protein product [Clonostachys byssicola]
MRYAIADGRICKTLEIGNGDIKHEMEKGDQLPISGTVPRPSNSRSSRDQSSACTKLVIQIFFVVTALCLAWRIMQLDILPMLAGTYGQSADEPAQPLQPGETI